MTGAHRAHVLRFAAGHRPGGGITPETGRLIEDYLSRHPDVHWHGEGEFGVFHASVTEPDGTRHLQAYTPLELLAKLRNLKQRPGPPDTG